MLEASRSRTAPLPSTTSSALDAVVIPHGTWYRLDPWVGERSDRGPTTGPAPRDRRSGRRRSSGMSSAPRRGIGDRLECAMSQRARRPGRSTGHWPGNLLRAAMLGRMFHVKQRTPANEPADVTHRVGPVSPSRRGLSNAASPPFHVKHGQVARARPVGRTVRFHVKHPEYGLFPRWDRFAPAGLRTGGAWLAPRPGGDTVPGKAYAVPAP